MTDHLDSEREGEEQPERRPHPLLMCDVNTLSYDHETKRGTLTIPAYHATDMNGCITLFTLIDPEVTEIRVSAACGDWMHYRKIGDRWQALDAGGHVGRLVSFPFPAQAVDALVQLREASIEAPLTVE